MMERVNAVIDKECGKIICLCGEYDDAKFVRKQCELLSKNEPRSLFEEISVPFWAAMKYLECADCAYEPFFWRDETNK